MAKQFSSYEDSVSVLLLLSTRARKHWNSNRKDIHLTIMVDIDDVKVGLLRSIKRERERERSRVEILYEIRNFMVDDANSK